MPRDSATQRARHKALVRTLIEDGMNQGNLDILDTVLAPTYRGPLVDGQGIGAVKELLRRYREAVPDAVWTIDEQIAEGAIVMTRFTAHGTQHGPLWGLPATRKRVAVQGVLISRCQDGAIAAQSIQADLLGLLQQLGVMPPLALDKALIVARVLRHGGEWAHEPLRS